MTITGNKRGRPFKLHPDELKHWTDKYSDNYNKVRTILFVNSVAESGLIGEEDEFAAYLLYDSVESRINSCKYGQGVYAGVHNDWDNVIVGCTDIISQKPDFWRDYCKMTKEFVKHDHRLAYRPTIDRINEDPEIGYRLSNITVLSHGDNAKKALSKPRFLFEIDLTDPFNVITAKGFRKYNSKQEAVEALRLKFTKDTGRLYVSNGKHYLIQSEALTYGDDELNEKYFDQEEEYKAQLPVAVLKDDNGNEHVLNAWFTFPVMTIKLKKQA